MVNNGFKMSDENLLMRAVYYIFPPSLSSSGAGRTEVLAQNQQESKPSNSSSSANKNTLTRNDIVFGVLTDIGISFVVYVAAQAVIRSVQKLWFLPRPDDDRRIFSRNNRSHRLSGNNKKSNNETDGPSSRLSRVQHRLTPYEATIAADVVEPSDLDVCLDDVGGMDDTVRELWELVVLPLRRPELFAGNALVRPPKGILLYGAPGTGKTLLAKALAAEGDAAFVNVRLSAIMDKYFGESNRLIDAVFSLARTLAPTVIFIDEVDAFLGHRSSDSTSTHSPLSTVKAEFLTLWDGMNTSTSTTNANNGGGNNNGNKDDVTGVVDAVIVLAATNRPHDIDPAVLRRLPRAFEIGLPNQKSRLQILRKRLRSQSLTDEATSYLPELARDTPGYSGSDLVELCRAAAMEPVREITRTYSMSMSTTDVDTTVAAAATPPQPRPIDVRDFQVALHKVKRTGETAEEYRRREEGDPQQRRQSPTGISPDDLVRGLFALQRLMQQVEGGSPAFGAAAPRGRSGEHSESKTGGNDDDNDDEYHDLDDLDDVPNL